MTKVKISLIGCGTIGREIALAIDKGIIPAKLVCLFDIDNARALQLHSLLKSEKPKITENLVDAARECDIIVESASVYAVKEISKHAFVHKKDLFVLSTGSLIDFPEILEQAKKHNCRVYYPSGAIVGLDAIVSTKLANIKTATLTTRKPPIALGADPDIKTEQVIFSGTAKEAIKKFPANINVSAALALSSIGPENTKVTIIADPKVKRNIHEVEVTGDFGRIFTRAENVPSANNPKTSYLAIISAISYLKKICEDRIHD